MKFQNLIITSGLCFLSISLIGQSGETRYDLTADKSYVKWVTRDDVGQYSGTFKVKSGYLTFKGESLDQVVVFVDMRSLECTNCGNSDDQQELVSYMTSGKFFNSQKMDYAVFKMYKFEVLSRSDEGNYRLEGDLTIKGYSNTISFPANIDRKKDKVMAECKFNMDRSSWKLDNPEGENSDAYTMKMNVTLSVVLEGMPK